MSNLIKIYPVGAQFRADRRTGGEAIMIKLVVAFRIFAKAKTHSFRALYGNNRRFLVLKRALLFIKVLAVGRM